MYLITTYHQKNVNLVCTEFEAQYQSAIHNIKVTNLPESKINLQSFQPVIVLKTKLRSTCEKYNTIKVPYKDRELNPHIILLHQEKNLGRMIMDKGKYIEKCRNILNTKTNYFVNYKKTLQKL